MELTQEEILEALEPLRIKEKSDMIRIPWWVLLYGRRLVDLEQGEPPPFFDVYLGGVETQLAPLQSFFAQCSGKIEPEYFFRVLSRCGVSPGESGPEKPRPALRPGEHPPSPAQDRGRQRRHGILGHHTLYQRPPGRHLQLLGQSGRELIHRPGQEQGRDTRPLAAGHLRRAPHHRGREGREMGHPPERGKQEEGDV